MNIGEAGITAILGYAVVFIGLVLLMAAIVIMGRVMTAGRKAAPVPAPAAGTAPAAAVAKPVAPGSAGEVKLFDVPDREAALLMAIVAEKMGAPLNELRFKSIKEVKEDEV